MKFGQDLFVSFVLFMALHEIKLAVDESDQYMQTFATRCFAIVQPYTTMKLAHVVSSTTNLLATLLHNDPWLR